MWSGLMLRAVVRRWLVSGCVSPYNSHDSQSNGGGYICVRSEDSGTPNRTDDHRATRHLQRFDIGDGNKSTCLCASARGGRDDGAFIAVGVRCGKGEDLICI